MRLAFIGSPIAINATRLFEYNLLHIAYRLRIPFIRVVTAPESNRETRLHAPASITTLINPRLSGASCLFEPSDKKRKRCIHLALNQIQGPLCRGVCRPSQSYPVVSRLASTRRI